MSKKYFTNQLVQDEYTKSSNQGKLTDNMKSIIKKTAENLEHKFLLSKGELLTLISFDKFELLIKLYPNQKIQYSYLTQVIKKCLMDIGENKITYESYMRNKRLQKIEKIL